MVQDKLRGFVLELQEGFLLDNSGLLIELLARRARSDQFRQDFAKVHSIVVFTDRSQIVVDEEL